MGASELCNRQPFRRLEYKTPRHGVHMQIANEGLVEREDDLAIFEILIDFASMLLSLSSQNVKEVSLIVHLTTKSPS